ncbi:MAG: glycosyltransferase family 4 protein [Deltaproteobacteria bacterium]|nr:glycosyltransferase family 4 protein [Deltaproteobacteria bacterium]
MKVLHINTCDILGGAARAAYRLHRALLNEGIESRMLVQTKKSDDWTVIGPEGKFEKFINLLRPHIDRLPVFFYKNRTKTLFSPSWLPFSNVLKKINRIDPDIVHLHWICGGMLRIEEIAKIRKPIVWTLHDNWIFTGGCHIKWNCDKYKYVCMECPNLNSNKKNDLGNIGWKRKKKLFSEKDIVIVCPSRWIYEACKESSILSGRYILNIPNLLDISVFKPFDKHKSRELWNLPLNKKLILFGAIVAIKDVNKGYHKLVEALKLIRTEHVELVVFGSSEPKDAPNLGFKTHYLGHLSDDISLVTLYSAADVMVVPSLQENFSNVIMESLACGTPVVAFNVGGNSDMIDHLQNGYLAKPFDSEELARGIDWVINNDNYEELCKNAREKILKEFDSKKIVLKYLQLYRDILENKIN